MIRKQGTGSDVLMELVLIGENPTDTTAFDSQAKSIEFSV
jgi:hypothetical protein